MAYDRLNKQREWSGSRRPKDTRGDRIEGRHDNAIDKQPGRRGPQQPVLRSAEKPQRVGDLPHRR